MAIIRPLVPGDYPVVAEISNDAATKGLLGRPVWETAREIAATVAEARQAEFVVAENDDGSLAGFAGYALSPEGQADLYGPLVVTSGHGIGAWLASRVESLARHRGAVSYAMLIGLANRSGAAWAEWRGYQRETEFPDTLMAWVYPGEIGCDSQTAGGVVRRAVPADLDQVENLYRTCYMIDTATRDDWATWLPDCWVLESDGAIQGLLHLDSARAEVRHLCVEPSRRRRALGSLLAAEGVKAFWQERPTKVGAVLSLDNRSGVALVRKLGFRREIVVGKWMKRDG